MRSSTPSKNGKKGWRRKVSRKPSSVDVPPPNFVSVVGLGCPKNQVDTENLLGELLRREVVICPDPADASVIIVNTCGFIAPARTEGAEVLDECIDHRTNGGCRLLAVVGCWVQRETRELRQRFPQVDLWMGLLTPERIGWLIEEVLGERRLASRPPGPAEALGAELGRVRLSPAHWAYLKIADGCDNRCAYCAIPDIRGRLRSKPHDAVVEEAQRLAEEGVKEINLVAQDITAYGHDVDGRPHLVSLLADLARVDGIEWIRLLYTHPAHFTDDLIALIAEEPKVCHYVDLPIQHVSDRILGQMGRRVTRRDIESLIGRLRDRVADVVLRTTVLVGFPGESEREFDELCDFLRDVRFERLGCFAYWPEPHTPAFGLPGLLPEDERLRRADRVMDLQQEIAWGIAGSWVGRELPVIVDEPGEKRGAFLGRTYGDAPEIDPVILLSGSVSPGEITRARVTEARGYDLVGTV